MAGYNKVYFVGGEGGFGGSDGVNPIYFQILIGDAGRQWLEPHYFKGSIRPLGNVQAIIPERPDHPLALLDSCIAFYPQHFQACPTLSVVERALLGATRLDFDQGRGKIPTEWDQLREEAMPWFKDLHIWEAKLQYVNLEALSRK